MYQFTFRQLQNPVTSTFSYFIVKAEKPSEALTKAESLTLENEFGLVLVEVKEL